MSDKKSKSKATEIIELLIDKFGREVLARSSQRQIEKEAKKGPTNNKKKTQQQKNKPQQPTIHTHTKTQQTHPTNNTHKNF